MKRIVWLCTCLIVLFVGVSLSSCDNWKDYEPTKANLDSTQVLKLLQEFDDPVFYDTEDMLCYQHSEKEWLTQDSIFFSIPQPALVNIASVLQKQGIKLTKATIVTEFMSNKKVYLNLPEPQPTAAQKELEDEVESVPNMQIKDTVINGQSMKVVTSNTIN